MLCTLHAARCNNRCSPRSCSHGPDVQEPPARQADAPAAGFEKPRGGARDGSCGRARDKAGG
eukprot:12150518-Alexandrium_andersonii.AAC.1